MNLLCISTVYKRVTKADVVRSLKEGIDIVNLPDRLWTTYIRLGMADSVNALKRASWKAHLEAMKLLVSLLPEPTYSAVLRILIDNDEHEDDEDEDEDEDYDFVDTPLANACAEGDIDMVKYLISIGADVSQEQDTVFSQACSWGNMDIVRFLVRAHPDVLKDTSAFASTCFEGHLDILQYLVSQGAEMDRNAIAWAAARSRWWDDSPQGGSRPCPLDIIKYLVSVGAPVDIGYSTSDESDPEVVRYLKSLV